jgi:hypothetical protein
VTGFCALSHCLAVIVSLLAGPAATEDLKLDFESPLYAAGADIDGVEGWRVIPASPKGTQDASLANITPSEQTGYRQVLDGKHSLAIFANARSFVHSFPPRLELKKDTILSFRIWAEVQQGQTGIYLGFPLDKGGTPVGIEAKWADEEFVFFGGKSGLTERVKALAGHDYQVEIVLDFSAMKARGYVTDLTAGSPRERLGEQVLAGEKLIPAEVARKGGILITKSGSVVIVDNIRIDPPPEK